MATYELWNTNSSNLVGTFSSEEEALRAVREALECYGASYVDSLALGCENSRGKSRLIASGRALADRATGRLMESSHRRSVKSSRIA